MPIELNRPHAAGALMVLALATGCASQVPAPPLVAALPPEPARAPVAAPVAARQASAPADAVLAYADRVRNLPASELAAEIQRFGDMPSTATQALQLAIALLQAGDSAQQPRAQMQVQRVLAQQDAEAQALQPLARLLAAQLADRRKADELADRQARDLREARRRNDALNERLEALRAIERSVPTTPAAPRAPR